MKGECTSASSHLSYWSTGAGQPVVFLHPTPLDHEYWRPVVERLPSIRAIAPDLRGHGASELGESLPQGGFALVPNAPVLTMGQYASDIVTLLDHLELDRAVFAGCSVGGYILLELWRQIHERMQGLAFVCSKPQPDTPQGQTKRVETIKKARAEGVSGIFDGMAQTLVGASTRAGAPEIVAEVRARMTLTAEALVAVQAGLGARPDSFPTLATILVPVLAIAGGEDVSVTPEEMESFRAAPGGCDYHLIQDAGHFAAYEHPERVATMISEWMQQRGLATS